MKMTKKLITLALAALMLLSLAVPAAAFLDENGFETTWYVSGEDFNITTVHLIDYDGPGGDIVIPFDVQVIEGGVFYKCTSLTSVTIPEYVSEIGWQAFWGCTNLTDVYFRGTREQWQAILSTHKETYEGPIFDEDANVTVHCNSNGPYVPPTPVTPDMRKDSDFEYAYWEYEGVILETGLDKYHGPGGDVVIPDGVDGINGSSFYFCQNLTSVVIPSGVTGIYYQAFSFCTNLKSITIPASVTTIGSDVFRGCINLKDVYFGGTQGQWAALEQQLKDLDYGPMFPQDVNPTVHYNSTGPDTPTTPAVPSQSESAMPTNDQLTVNGTLQNPTVYKIGGSNFFKIRDLAAMLNGSEKQFDVGYDGALASVTLTTGRGYAKLDTDMAGAATGGNQTATPSNDTIYINGQKIDVTVYKIGGSNYFKLRDLGKALGFYVGWTAADGMFIDTGKPYSE